MRFKLLSLFKVYEGEGVKVSLFFILGILLQIGTTIGLALSDALFLSRLGASHLPYIFIVLPGVMFFIVPIFSYLINYFRVQKLFYMVFIIMGVLSTLFGLYLPFTDSQNVIFLLKVYTYTCLILTYTIYWSFIDEYFSILDAKRLYPLFSGALTLGAIFGGSLVLFFGNKFSPSFFLYIWSSICVVGIFWLAFSLKKTKALEVEQASGPFISEVKDVYSYIRKTNFFYIVNIVLLLTVFISAICEYRYSIVLSKEYSEEELVPLLGMLFTISNIFTLFINFFVFGRLISRIGISNTILIQPVVYFVTFVVFLLEGGVISAFVGFFAYHAIMVSFDYNNWNFLFNAFPGRFKKMIRSFTENLVDPFATAVAGIFLLVSSLFLSEQEISVVALCISIVFYLIILFLRSEYLKAMVTTLKEGYLSFSQSDYTFGSSGKNISNEDLEILQNALVSGNPKTLKISFYALMEHDPIRATLLFLSSLQKMSLKVKNECGSMFLFILEYKDGVLVRYVLEWLESQKTSGLNVPPSLLEELSRCGFIDVSSILDMKDINLDEKEKITILALWNSWDINDTIEALNLLEKMLKSSNERLIIIGVLLIGKMRYPKYAYFLLPYLRHKFPEVRRAAISSISALLNDDTEYLITELIKMLEEGELSERLDILKAFFRVKDASFLHSLLRVSDRFSFFERRRVIEIIYHLGEQSIPTLVTIFGDESETYQVRSLVAKALGNVSPAQYASSFSEVVYQELINAYEILYAFTLLENMKDRGKSFVVMYHFFKSILGSIIDFILQTLAIAGQFSDLELVSRSLHSTNIKERSNAIETLEQGVSHKIFNILLPLIDGRSVSERLDFFWNYVKKGKISSTFSKNASFDEVLDRSLSSPFLLEFSIGLYTYWELNGTDKFSGLYEKTSQVEHPLCKEVFLSLLERSRGSSGMQRFSLNIVDKLYYMLQTPLFSSIGVLGFQVIAEKTEDIVYKKGEQIFKKGENANFFYLIVDGDIAFEEEHASLGSLLCEISHFVGFNDCFEKGVYNSTCIAASEVLVLKISKKFFLGISLSDFKVAWALLREVKTNSTLSNLLIS